MVVGQTHTEESYVRAAFERCAPPRKVENE
jgi:hypothetical protein